jgi:hypothetical protein
MARTPKVAARYAFQFFDNKDCFCGWRAAGAAATGSPCSPTDKGGTRELWGDDMIFSSLLLIVI